MRLQEILSDEEWQRFEQLIYTTVWRALSTYPQQLATQQRIASKPAATLKPQTAKKAKTLARKAKRIPHVAPPRPLPKPKPQPQAKAETTPTFRPVKAATPLPPTTKSVVANARTPAPQPTPRQLNQQVMPMPQNIDQAGRRLLPKDKQGMNPIDLLSLDERG